MIKNITICLTVLSTKQPTLVVPEKNTHSLTAHLCWIIHWY